MLQVSYLLLGMVAGLISGALGVGGGAILVPGMVFLYGLTQLQAQGTSLAIMLPPVFILGVLRYHHEGNVNIPIALFAAIGLTIGALVGAHFIQTIPEAVVKRGFGIFMIVVGLKMLLFK